MLVLCLASALVPQAPSIGEHAPEPGVTSWAREKPQRVRNVSGGSQTFPLNGGKTHAATLADLAGRVVLLHVFSPTNTEALTHTVPLVRDLLAANADRAIGAVALMPAQDDAEAFADELGLAWPLGLFDGESESAYLAAGAPRSNALWLVGRSGQLVWHGDPATEEKALLEAVAAQLALPAAPPLGRPLAAPLRKAQEAYYEGRWQAARSQADKVRRANERAAETDPEAARAVEDARHLSGLVAEHEAVLRRQALEALDRRRLLSFLGLQEAARHGFAKSPLAKELDGKRKELRKSMGAGALDDAQALFEALADRPVLFPARRSRAGDRLDKELEKFLKRSSNDVEPTQRARFLRDLYEKARHAR